MGTSFPQLDVNKSSTLEVLSLLLLLLFFFFCYFFKTHLNCTLKHFFVFIYLAAPGLGQATWDLSAVVCGI